MEEENDYYKNSLTALKYSYISLFLTLYDVIPDGAVIQIRGFITSMKSKRTHFSMVLIGKTSGKN